MSSFQIMQNLHYFFTKVLKDAHARKDFDVQSINKALQWAEYCKKVYESCQGKRLETQLDEGLKKLFLLDTTWNAAPVDINSVRNAVELLRRALLRNPYLSHEEFNTVVKAFENETKLIDDCIELARCGMNTQVYRDLLKEMAKCEHPGADDEEIEIILSVELAEI